LFLSVYPKEKEMGFKLGMNGKLYYEDGGFSADAANDDKPDISGGVGVELTIAKDVTLNLEKATADVTTRGNNGFRATVGTLKDGSVDMQIQWDPESAAFQSFLSAWLNETPIGLSVLDEAYTAEATPGAHDGTGSGLITNFSINDFTREEGLEDAMTANITATPTFTEVQTAWLDRGGFL